MPDTRLNKPMMKLLGIEQLICQYDNHCSKTSKKKLHSLQEQKQNRYSSLIDIATSKKPPKTITTSKPQMSNQSVTKIYTNNSIQLTHANQNINQSRTFKKQSRNMTKHQESKGKIMSSLINFSSKKGVESNQSYRKTSIKNGKDSESVGSASQAVIKQSIQSNNSSVKGKIQSKDQSMYLSYLSLKSRKIQAQKLSTPNHKEIDIQSATLAGINKKIRQFQKRGFRKNETVMFRKSVKPQCTQEWQKTPEQIKTVRFMETVRAEKQRGIVSPSNEILSQQKQFVSIDTTYYGFSFKNKVPVVSNSPKEELVRQGGSTLDKSTQQQQVIHPVDSNIKKISSSTSKIQPAKKTFSSLTIEQKKKTRYPSTNLLKSKKPNSSLLLKPKLLLKDRYKLTKIIGRGMSGEVYQAQDILSDRYVVIKEIDVNSIQYEFFREITHQNVIRYYNNFVENGKRYLVLEYFPMTLKDLIKDGKRNAKIEENEIKHIFKSIIDGLSYLHSLSIAHRDIKLDNIVISEDLTEIKFIDFGLCMDLCKIEHGLSKEFCGTLSYLPPEIARGQPHEPKKADIWSLGILFYAIAVGRLPFKGKNQSEVLNKICKGKTVFPENINPSLKELIESMLEKDPKKRFTVGQVMSHEWMH